MRVLPRFLRERPWWTGGVALAILVFGGWWVREEWAARRLLEEVAAHRLRVEMAEWRSTRPGEPATRPVPDEENAAVAWLEALRLRARALKAGPAPAPVPGSSDGFAGAATVDEEVLALLEASLERPRFQLPDPVTVEGRFESLAALFLARGHARAARGEWGAAVRSWLGVHRMRRLVKGGTGSAHFISDEQVMEATVPLIDTIKERRIEEPDLAFLVRHALRPAEYRESATAFFDRVWVPRLSWGLEQAALPGGAAWLRGQGLKEPTLDQRLLRSFGRPYPQGVKELPTAVEALKTWRAIAGTAEAHRRRGPGTFPLVIPDPGFRKEDADPAWYFENYLRSGVRDAFAEETWLSLLRAAAGVRLYQARTGRLPAGLENLVPDVLDSVPEDPFTGEFLRWTHVDDRGVLRSAGPPPGDLGVSVTGFPGKWAYSVELR